VTPEGPEGLEGPEDEDEEEDAIVKISFVIREAVGSLTFVILDSLNPIFFQKPLELGMLFRVNKGKSDMRCANVVRKMVSVCVCSSAP
jgi:hypothetical protein